MEKVSAADSPSDNGNVIQLVSEVASRYEMSSLRPLLRVCKSAAARNDLSIAVLGRFKAGKSSFLNHFLGRDVLPVGVIPVTSVVTEMLWGPEEHAEVRFLDGRIEPLDIDVIGEFITEAKNPENRKRVSGVCLYLPEFRAYPGLRFVDTPGLDSAFAHNTEASLAWVPNVDVALVAVGVDPSLAQQDVALIRKLFEYTPKVCVLLTKVDILSDAERHEVFHFVREQLNQNFEQQIEIFRYSTRPGFEWLRSDFEERFIGPTLGAIRDRKREILAHKLRTLLRECSDYLQLTLRSAEMIDAQRQELRARAIGEQQALADTKLELQLVAWHNIGITRSHTEKILRPYERRIEAELFEALEQEYRAWKMSFARLLERFESWLGEALSNRLAGISASHRSDFLKPLRDVERQYIRVLQGFRDRLSERAMDLFGVPLRTTETEIEPESPKAPDIKIGRMFDHNWELLSPIIPMTVFRGVVKARFLRKMNDESFKNLSRLTSQWADLENAAIVHMQHEAERRLEDLVQTVERLTASSRVHVPNIKSDLDRVCQALAVVER